MMGHTQTAFLIADVERTDGRDRKDHDLERKSVLFLLTTSEVSTVYSPASANGLCLPFRKTLLTRLPCRSSL